MMNFVTLLIQATALMAALIVLRPLLKRFVSPRARCALWAIPALRLLLPFELQSPLSIMAPAQTVSDTVTKAVSQPTGIEAPSWLGSGIGLENTAPAPAADTFTAAPESGISLSTVLLIIWLIGAAATAGLIIYQNSKFKRSAKRHSEYLGDGFGLPLYLLGALPTPCLMGAIRPRIYINRQTLVSDEVLEMTIRHEMTHYRRLDHIWGAVRGLLLALYWFHPLVWLCSELFRADCETACDAAATRGMDEEEKQSYGMALITLASRVPRGSTGRLVCLSTMNGDKKLLRERISLLAKGRTLRCALLIAVMLAAVLCFTMCTVPNGGSDEQNVTPPSPTPGFMGEEPIAPEEVPNVSHAQAIPLPMEESQGTLSDLSWYLELSAVDTDFIDMSQSQLETILSEYGRLLDGYELIPRVSTDGKSAYIAGRFMGDDAESPLNPMYSIDFNGEAQVLYTGADSEKVETALALGELPDSAYIIRNSSIRYSQSNDLILIEPFNVETSLDTAFSYYVYTPNGRAYIADAVERGISICRPEGAYLEIYLISEKWGEISERIPLTDAEAEAILNEELTEIIPGFGFAATLYHDETHELYNENRGIPQSVLDLAIEKCDYRFGDPGMITAPLTEAKLECSWLNTPVYADEEGLERLGEILKNAQFGYVGACGYGAKLTIRMEGGEMVTMFKGTDGCDTIVFGSYSGYFLGDTENTEFWSIFGLDVDSKMPKAPEARLAYASTSTPLLREDAQYIYNVINTGKWTSGSPDCACDYSFYFEDEYYIYHSDCGSIIDINNNRSISTDAATMEKINDILAQYTGT